MKDLERIVDEQKATIDALQRRVKELEEEVDIRKAVGYRHRKIRLKIVGLWKDERYKTKILSDQKKELIAENAELKRRVEELKLAGFRRNEDITQTLGKALGYPYFKDDPKNFPTATEDDGVCVGEHVAESIAAEAARVIGDLKRQVVALREAKSISHLLDRFQAKLKTFRPFLVEYSKSDGGAFLVYRVFKNDRVCIGSGRSLLEALREAVLKAGDEYDSK